MIRLLDLGYLRWYYTINTGNVKKTNSLFSSYVQALSTSDQKHFCQSEINHERQTLLPINTLLCKQIFHHPVLSMIFCSLYQQTRIRKHKSSPALHGAQLEKKKKITHMRH